MTARMMKTEGTGEKADLLSSLAQAREFLSYTCRELSEEDARKRSTVSELTLGGLIKHVTAVERNWTDFIVNGPDSAAAKTDYTQMTEADFARYADGFRLLEDETLAGVLADYRAAAEETTKAVEELADLSLAHELPETPWGDGGSWSARRTLIHIISETTQHAGHADIIRESLDGQKTMG
ncbi:DinB family protein [Arthrobacter sp. NPDC090010]|uniref:DinB family protein n=1 Tax=Arthrobacter sp. NPDC090010 TaxID=3363942 RepID=UPI003828C68F